MLTPFDDYPVHQTALPVAHPESGDPNHYDRYFLNAYREDRYVGVAMGLYPNRGVIDAAISVVHDGVQRSVFASGRAPIDRAHTQVGPISIEVVEPLRTLRVAVEEGHGIGADLRFTARTAAVEEPRQTMHDGTRLAMDSTRLTQWGTWVGAVTTGGETLRLDGDYGTKDRSWGVRPIGDATPAAPSLEPPQVFFLWAPINFDDRVAHALCFERADGTRLVDAAAMVPVLAGPDAPTWGPDVAVERLAGFEYELRWVPGLRRAEAATIVLPTGGDRGGRIDLEPLLAFRMRGIGYTHPEWGHGKWRGELEVGAEEHAASDLDVLEPGNVHNQQVVRARWGDRTGLGVLETIAFGPHAPTGLRDLLDGG